MSANKHTPGPWSAGAAGSITAQTDASLPMMDYQIALAISPVRGEKGQAVREANARLIAAAPELLEALQEMVSLVEMVIPFDGPQQRKARAAIAKAAGDAQ